MKKDRKQTKKRRWLMSQEEIKKHPWLFFLHDHMHEPRLWHFTQHSVSRAAFIGIFWCFMPMPFQMVAAAITAVLARANLILSIGLVWISNPVTMIPMMWGCYKLGSWLLSTPTTFSAQKLTVSVFFSHVHSLLWPTLLGSVICGLSAGALCFLIVRVFWVLIEKRIQTEKQSNR